MVAVTVGAGVVTDVPQDKQINNINNIIMKFLNLKEKLRAFLRLLRALVSLENSLSWFKGGGFKLTECLTYTPLYIDLSLTK